VSEQIPHEPSARKYYVAALIASGVGLTAGTIIEWLHPHESGLQLKAGVSIFAFLYVAAQSIERLVEMIVLVLDGLLTNDKKGTQFVQTRKTRALAVARKLRRGLTALGPQGVGTTSTQTINSTNADLDRAERAIDWSKKVMQILTLGLSFGISFVLLAWIGMGLFGLVLAPRGDNSAVPLWVDWALTAAVLTGGAKGLHDLLSKIQSSKDSDDAA
jgi:hypothetical protein